MTSQKTNRLALEKSPYLLQHSNNPINWYPWCEEAFVKAKKENKPVFLSIGYSTCHWCHVMEKESFEDMAVAQVMNDSFVSIKVDREERPDIDHIYMNVCQILTGRGGWPLSLFLTPDKKPFFADTYFPKDSRQGIIGLTELLINVKNLWNQKHNDLLKSAEEITEALATYNRPSIHNNIDLGVIHKAYKYYLYNYDEEYGGFGGSPKFPSPHNLMFLIRYGKIFNDDKAVKMVLHTLIQMRNGGIYDQLGFGFHRYSTDSKWIVPHFEKMLYDQALLLIAFSEAYLISKNDFYKKTAYEIFEYLINNLLSPEGCFYSAEDADSDGLEGTFYFWEQDEIYKILGSEKAELFCKVFNVNATVNYKDDNSTSGKNNNILHIKNNMTDLSDQFGIDTNTFLDLIEYSRKKLLKYRQKRIRPFMDNKILTDWNGLIIASLAITSRIMNDKVFSILAEKCFNSILFSFFKDDNLYHTNGKEKSMIKANLDDYSFLIWGLLELYRSTFINEYLSHAIKLTNIAIDKFYDNQNGGFYFSEGSSDDLIIRTKEFYDGAVPSGNSVMLNNLTVLFEITSEIRYKEISEKTFEHFSDSISDNPYTTSFSLIPLLMKLKFGILLIVVGDFNSVETLESLQRLNSIFMPSVVLIFKDITQTHDIEYLETYTQLNNKTTYYLCKDHVCSLPTNSIDEILNKLS